MAEQTSPKYLTIDESIYKDNTPIIKSTASRTFVGWNDHTSIKSDYRRGDYDYLRKTTQEGTGRASILKKCQDAYDNVGIVKNVIDLMSDFGSKGIRIRHPDPDINKFCQKWAEKIFLQERSERFLNCFYRQGAVVIYHRLGRATNDITSKYIPIKYIFLNPASVEVKDEHTGIIPGEFEYVLLYSNNSITRMVDKTAVQSVIPEELKKYKDGRRPLPKDRISVYNYRKDDWQFWGKPILNSILKDLQLLEKLKLSDISALDGVISTIRLWRVGIITDSPATTILPTKAMINKIREMIAQGISGGSMDLVFGPEVDFKESNTNVHQFLGKEKYEPTLDAIYEGLGIPAALRNSSSQANNSNIISLKTLIERLNYGRMSLVDFWTNQLKNIFKTLGFETDDDPIIEFDYMVLADEAAEKKLLLDMIDRDIVDMELVHERFKIPSNLTKSKLKEEVDQRGNELPVKASPFHNPHVEDEMKKLLLQNGDVIPAEVGLDIKVSKVEQERRYQEKKQMEKKSLSNKLGNKKASNTPGRPKNITETSKRKPKTAKAAIWATAAQKQISDIYTPIVLKIYNKKNVRSLSNEETIALEEAKASILLGLEPFEEVNIETIYKAISKKTSIQELKQFWNEFEDMNPTVDQLRQLTSIFYGASLDG